MEASTTIPQLIMRLEHEDREKEMKDEAIDG